MASEEVQGAGVDRLAESQASDLSRRVPGLYVTNSGYTSLRSDYSEPAPAAAVSMHAPSGQHQALLWPLATLECPPQGLCPG